MGVGKGIPVGERPGVGRLGMFGAPYSLVLVRVRGLQKRESKRTGWTVRWDHVTC